MTSVLVDGALVLTVVAGLYVAAVLWLGVWSRGD